MKCLALLALLLTGCYDSLYDPHTGKCIARWQSDRAFFYYKSATVETGSQSALFSPVIRSNWHGGANFVGTVGADIIGLKLAGARTVTGALLSGATVGTAAVTTRPIRSTPTPAPVKTQ